jgi:hypothetical protein
MITHTELLSYLFYCPETGVFTWRQDNGRAREGQIAGRATWGYIGIKIDHREYKAHRLAWFYMTQEWPPDQVDHKDRNRANNRWTNLRLATNKQNHENLPVLRTNKSGVPGVRWDARRGKWFSFIRSNGRMKNLGRFSEMGQAVLARKSAEAMLFTHA